MQIKPIPFTPDSTGLPAKGYAYYIGLPNEDPTIEENQQIVRDGRGGPQTSNPFFVNANGNFQNENGQPINPWIDAASYSVLVLDTFGARYRYIAEYSADGLVNGNDGEPEFTINNLEDEQTGAKYQDISQYKTVFIQSLESGWEDTVDGPIGGFHAHRDGTSGQASTGDENKFFDASGTGFSRNDKQRIDETQFNDLVQQSNTNAADIIALRSGFIDGLQTTWVNVSDITIDPGSCSDDAGTVIIDFAGFTAEINNTIANGGNREGTLIAETWYHVFICALADGSVPRVAFSPDVSGFSARQAWTNETGNDYDVSRLIWSVYVDDNSEIKQYYQYDDFNQFYTNNIESSTTSSSPQLITILTPLGLVTEAKMNAYLASDVNDNLFTDFSAAPGSQDQDSARLIIRVRQTTDVNIPSGQSDFDVFTSTTSQIWRQFTNEATQTRLATTGFKHPRRAP